MQMSNMLYEAYSDDDELMNKIIRRIKIIGYGIDRNVVKLSS